MHDTYAIERLPQDSDTHLRRKFAVLYNEALRAIFPGEDLILQAPNILLSPEALYEATRHQHTWICVAPNAHSGATSLSEGQWVGMYSLHGPLECSRSSYFEADASLFGGEDSKSLWVTRRMYVQEEHRSKETILGLQQALEAHIRKYHNDMGSGGGKAKVRMTAKEGSAAFALHSTNAQKVRGMGYRELLEESGTMQRVPSALTGARSEQEWTEPWAAVFEMHVDL
jgi:hypothetical protein